MAPKASDCHGPGPQRSNTGRVPCKRGPPTPPHWQVTCEISAFSPGPKFRVAESPRRWHAGSLSPPLSLSLRVRASARARLWATASVLRGSRRFCPRPCQWGRQDPALASGWPATTPGPAAAGRRRGLRVAGRCPQAGEAAQAAQSGAPPRLTSRQSATQCRWQRGRGPGRLNPG
jgi:hypothetical protein